MLKILVLNRTNDQGVGMDRSIIAMAHTQDATHPNCANHFRPQTAAGHQTSEAAKRAKRTNE